MKHLKLSLVALFCCVNVAFAQTPSDFSFKETYKVSTPAEMAITINDGFINVNSNESREIEVFYIVKKNYCIIMVAFDSFSLPGNHLKCPPGYT